MSSTIHHFVIFLQYLMESLTENFNKFGVNLRIALAAKGLTQQQLADIIGATQQAVSRWVVGNREPAINDILRICLVLDEDPNNLLGYNEIPCETAKRYKDMCKNIK